MNFFNNIYNIFPLAKKTKILKTMIYINYYYTYLSGKVLLHSTFVFNYFKAM